MRWLIVTGDDFGMSRGINRGIIEAYRRGILTSTSLLVNRPASEEAASLGRQCAALCIGLHLELTDLDHAPAEVERQLGRFRELVGAMPTHLDSHHDGHEDPRVLPCVLARAAGLEIPVRGHSGIRRISSFYGQWGGESHPEQVGVEVLVRLLDTEVREGVAELICHPGYVEPGFRSSYAAERELELRTLCDRRVKEAIAARNIRLIGIRDAERAAQRAPATEQT